MKGGLRIVVYTDALQTVVLLVAAVDPHRGRPRARRRAGAGSTRGSRPRCSRWCRPATDADYPWPGMFFARLPRGELLLVDGPGPRAAGVRGQGPERGPKGRDPLRLPEADDAVPPRPARADRAGPLPRTCRRPDQAYGGPAAAHHAGGPPRPDDQRDRRRAHGPHQRDLQLGLDARHAGLLPALAARGLAGGSRSASAGWRSWRCSSSAPRGRR